MLRPVLAILQDISSIMKFVAQAKPIHEYFSKAATLIKQWDEKKQERKKQKCQREAKVNTYVVIL